MKRLNSDLGQTLRRAACVPHLLRGHPPNPMRCFRTRSGVPFRWGAKNKERRIPPPLHPLRYGTTHKGKIESPLGGWGFPPGPGFALPAKACPGFAGAGPRQAPGVLALSSFSSAHILLSRHRFDFACLADFAWRLEALTSPGNRAATCQHKPDSLLRRGSVGPGPGSLESAKCLGYRSSPAHSP